MLTSERVELVTGIGILLYRQSNPDQVLATKENNAKELTGKLAGQWVPSGYETHDLNSNGLPETYAEVIDRYGKEEIRKLGGQIFIPERLEESKLLIARISPPEMAAWVHSFRIPVSDDFEVEPGDFENEIGDATWVSAQKLLDLKGTDLQILLRAGSYEILEAHVMINQGLTTGFGIHENPVNLPNWQTYRLMEKGVTQDVALSQLGIDPQPLKDSSALIRSL